MKTFKSLIAEVAQPAAEDEINFKEKHVIDHILDPNSEEDQFTADKIKKFKNRADYAPGEDKEVYESAGDNFEEGDVVHFNYYNTSQGRTHIGKANVLKTTTKFVHVKHPDPERAGIYDNDVFKFDKTGKEIGGIPGSRIGGYTISKAPHHPDFLHLKEGNIQLKDIPVEDGRSNKTKNHKEINLKTIIDEGLDPVGREDSDIDNDGKLTKSDLFLHARRRAINKKLRREGIEPVVPTGGEFDSDDSHKKYKKSNKTKLQEVSLEKLNNYRKVAFDNQLDSIDKDDMDTYTKRQKGRAVANDKISGYAKVKATRPNMQEAYIPGTLKLKDGSSVTMNAQTSDLLNKMFSQLKDENKTKMEDTLMSGKNGFNQIVGFAKEIS